jgi:hypothetical protein
VTSDLAFEDADALFVPDPGQEYGGAFAVGISSAGDQDGDGLPEVAIGAPSATVSAGGEGMVYLFQGLASGVLEASLAWSVLEGEREQDAAGMSVDHAGDVDGDGRADLVVGAEDVLSGARRVGAVYVVLGPVAEGRQSLADAAVRVVGTYHGDYPDLGTDVHGAGDTNGDGLDDLLVTGWIEVEGEDIWPDYLHSHLLLGRE